MPTQAAPVEIDLTPALARPGPTFEGWGTALAWFAEVTGGWPDPARERLADLLYGADGLGWTIARYNIGGGNAADTPPYLRVGAEIPGMWHLVPGQSGANWNPDSPDQWDWGADANQRWWLDAVRRRVKAPLFEAFSNSPPWFMTVSGRVSGAEDGNQDNLQAGKERLFATYLARTVEELQKRHGIIFRTLSPMNEPNTDYWHATNTQEGAHWSPERQAAMIVAADEALQSRHLATRIAAPDETNSHLFLRDWAAYPASVRARVGQINVHSYGTIHQTGVRDVALSQGIRLWMSENDTPLEKDPESFSDNASALAFAEHVVSDLKRLEPSAWVFWQAVETLSARPGTPGSNWGLIKADLGAAPEAPHPLHVTAKYWAMAQFSRFIRPGYRLVRVDDADTVGALSADGRTLALVHVNGGIIARRLRVNLPGWRAQGFVSDVQHQVAPLAPERDRTATIIAPARSVVTMVLHR